MKHLNLILGISIFIISALAGMGWYLAYELNKENEKLKSNELDWSEV